MLVLLLSRAGLPIHGSLERVATYYVVAAAVLSIAGLKGLSEFTRLLKLRTRWEETTEPLEKGQLACRLSTVTSATRVLHILGAGRHAQCFAAVAWAWDFVWAKIPQARSGAGQDHCRRSQHPAQDACR